MESRLKTLKRVCVTLLEEIATINAPHNRKYM